MHPERGRAPRLFDPMSAPEPELIVFQLEEDIKRWIAPGRIDSFQVSISGYNSIENTIAIAVEFVPTSAPSRHLLVFPFYQYQGTKLVDTNFIDAITLDGEPFRRLK